jgi:predicted metal-dependent HD superfamily phosphohydrolase
MHLDTVSHLAKYPHEIELALWFHDAIYKPRSSTNEQDSASWASDFLTLNAVSQKTVKRIYDLIMATLYTAQTNSLDEDLIVDIDLTILGSEKITYDQFEKNIRQEYRWVPTFVFRKKRKDILVHLLERDRIYKNKYFYDKFEQQARVNLYAAIAAL